MADITSTMYLVVLASVVITATATNYCNMKSCMDAQHTMCMFKSPKPAAACTNSKDAKLSANEKQDIVKKHNELRQKVASGQETRGASGPQPPATNMQTMSWDDELAEIAQRWANQCQPGHDRCRNVDRFYVGQNMAMMFDIVNTTNTNLEKMIEMWYDEVDLFNGNVDHYVFDPQVGHYTQIVWADTNKVGCGRIKYNDNAWDVHYLICNYGPGGNIQGAPIYKTP